MLNNLGRDLCNCQPQFIELFGYFCASTVSMTLEKKKSTVLLYWMILSNIEGH
jgi:hypothetical protein